MEKGFKTLELIGDLDDKYIYEASKPWKKQHRFFHIQRSWKTAVAGIILLIMVGCTLRYQEDVKAALQRVTSWIGQALGIKNGDTDSYTNVVGKSISRDGITITLNEIVMDSKNLWIAYSDSEDLDADMKDAVEDKLLYTEVCINGQEIQQGLGQRTVNAFSENPITVEDFTIGKEVNTEGTVNIESVSYTHLRAHETDSYLVCRLLLEKKKKTKTNKTKYETKQQNTEVETKKPARPLYQQ